MKTKRKNIFKSLLALTLALIMVLGVAPISELAGVDWASLFASKAEAAGKTYGIYTYEVGTDGKITITGCDKSANGAITIPSKIDGKPVTSIGDGAFYNCTSLTSITIPNSITSIGKNSFITCWSLTNINVASGNNYFSSKDGILFNKDKTTLIRYPEGSKRAVYSIPSTVRNIGEDAFSYSNLTSITIPDSVTSIGSWAFTYCDGLTSITIPNSVRNIEDYTFAYSHSLTSITIPNSVTSIGFCAFDFCEGLTSITIPNSVTSIGDGAFYNCTSLTSITIPNSVTSIGIETFSRCDSLTSITIPNSVTSIEDGAFRECINLKSITIPNGVTSIGDYAFGDCDSLTSITIPSSVTSIGDFAFYHCYNLSATHYTGTLEQWRKISIGDRNECLTSNVIIETDSSNGALISTINTDSTSVSVGDSIEITFKLKDDANDSKKPNISIVVENPGIFESSVKNKKDCAVVKLTAKKVGTTTLTVTEKSTGEILYYSLNAVAQINAFDLNTVPRRTDILKNHVTNFYGYGGLIVDGMTSTKLSNGNYKVSMSVYNTKNIYGAVVTYYEDGSVCDYRMIDRFDCYETGLWDVLESMYYFPGQTANLFRKYTLYTNGNLAQKTAIDGIIVPKGGYMQITNNSEESAIAYLYNIINFAVAGTLSAAGVITTMAGINVVDKSNVASKTAAEAIMKTIKSMPRDKAGDVMEDLLKDIAEQNMEAKSYDQIDDMIASTNNVLARAANIDMKSFISSSLKAVGISVAENAILSFLSTPGKWLSAIFTINSGVSYLDFSFSFVKSYKNTSIYVNAPRNGTISTMNGVKIDTQNNVDVKTVMQAFKIIDTSTITVNLSRNEVIEKSQIYNVYFTRDNEKVQPSGSVKIYLPLPDDYDPENSYILRQESNGKWTKLETKRENGYLVAETDHFSLYAVAQVSKKDSIFKKIWNAILAPFRAISRFFKNLFKKIFKK